MTSNVSYLTAEGAERLKEELSYLKGPSREALSKRLRSAIEQGDLSENADYISAKEEQGFLEGRIQELEQILSDHITIQEDEYEPETFHMVGPKEADPGKFRISHESPIGKALLGHKVGDIVSAETPNGSIRLKIIKIE